MNEAGKAVIEQFQKQIGEIKDIPTTVVLNKKGQIVYKHAGFAESEDFEKIITPLF